MDNKRLKSPKWIPNRPITLLYVLVLVLVLLSSVFLRFYNFEGRGLDGSDNVLYTTNAKAWAEGYSVSLVPGTNTQLDHRPVLLLVYAAAIKIFGYQDSSIKKMNAFLDMTNVLLIFLICCLLVPGSLIPAFSASIFYAFLPMAINMARIELPHVLSGFLVLLAFYTFLLYFTSTNIWRKRMLLILAGILIGLGSLTHEDLIFLAPGYLIFLLLVFLYQGGRRSQLRALFIDSSLLSASIVLTSYRMLLHYMAFAYEQAVTPFGESTIERVFGFLERVPRLLRNSILANSSSPVLYLFILLLLILCLRIPLMKLLSRHRSSIHLPLLYYLPLVLILTYFTFYSYFIYSYYNSRYWIRFFLPLFPLIIIFLVVCYSALLSSLNLAFSRVAVLLVALILIPFNLEHFHKWRSYMSWKFTTTWASASIPIPFKLGSGYRMMKDSCYSMSWERTVYEKLKSKVSSDSRLLITPSILYPWAGRRALQIEYYFGDDAIYLIDHTEPLDELISKYRIKYVLFTNHMADNRVLEKRFYSKYQYGGRWKSDEELLLGASYGFKPGEYTLDREYRALTKFLQGRGASSLYKEDGKVLIFQLEKNFFIEHLEQAVIETPQNGWVTPLIFNIDGDARVTLFEHPPSKITYKLSVPENSSLSFGIALKTEVWSADKGDGVLFEILVKDGREERKIFSKYIDPKSKIEDRKWHDERVDLSEYEGKEVLLTLITSPGPSNNTDYDWPGWGDSIFISNNK